MFSLSHRNAHVEYFFVRVVHIKWRNYCLHLLIDISNDKWNNSPFILRDCCSVFMVVLLQFMSSYRFRKSISWKSVFMPLYGIWQQRSLDMPEFRKERPIDKLTIYRILWVRKLLTDTTDTPEGLSMGYYSISYQGPMYDLLL